jgi:hypothetical protein
MILHTTKLLKDYSQNFAFTEHTNSYKDSQILIFFPIIQSSTLCFLTDQGTCYKLSMNASNSWDNSKQARAMHVLMNSKFEYANL